MICVENLRYTLGAFSLAIPSFDVKKGELHVLLGPTGSGKTLLLEYIAGLLPKASGQMSIDGRQAERLPPEHRGISYVPQDLALFPHLTVAQNIEFSFRFRKVVDRKHLDRLIQVTGIEKLLTRFPAKLSGGEKQRVALVRALASEPELLLLDEPFSALHPSMKLTFWHLIKRLHEELELTVLMVSHDVEEALALGDVVSFISQGEIKQTAKRKEIYYHPKALEIAEFFGFHNIFAAEVAEIDRASLFLATPGLGRIEASATHREAEIKKGANVWWGIHADEITVVKPDRRGTDRQNLLRCRVVDQVELGRAHIFRLRPLGDAGDPPLLELNLSDHAARKLAIQPGQQVDVELEPERIFVLPKRS